MSHDAIVIGAGHNGLACAATLAAQGRTVLVLERSGQVGGLAASEEFCKGYKTAGVLADTSRLRPRVVQALELERHGLQRRAEVSPRLSAAADGPGLLLPHDVERARAELSPADADGYAAFRAFLARVGPFATRLLDAPPPDLLIPGLAAARPLLGTAWALRRLGKRTMLDVLRIAPMCASDWLRENFEDDRLRALLSAPAIAGTWAGPRSAGTAALVLMHECMRGPEVEGGAPALVQALRSACESRGVEILTGAGVQRIAVHDGAVTGVELDSGDVLPATAIASSADPRQTLLRLIEPRDLPPGLESELLNWRCRGTTAVLHLALDGPFDLLGRPGERVESMVIGEDLAALERAFDAVKYGEMSEHPMLEVRVPTVRDRSLAPKGHEVVSVVAHFAPHELRGGWDDAARDLLRDRCLDRLASVAPTVRDHIVGHELLTPVDLEQRYGLTGGHVHHGEHALDQLFWLRPAPQCARYATPLRGLFLCGSGSHPGGGLSCGPGALGAAAVLGGTQPPVKAAPSPR